MCAQRLTGGRQGFDSDANGSAVHDGYYAGSVPSGGAFAAGPYPYIQYVPVVVEPPRTIANRIRSSVIPVSLIGAGLAWLSSDYKKKHGVSPLQHFQHGRQSRVATTTGSTAVLQTTTVTVPGHERTDVSSHHSGVHSVGSGSTSPEPMFQQITHRLGETGRELAKQASIAGQRLTHSALVGTYAARLMGQAAAMRLRQSTKQSQERLNQVSLQTSTRIRETAEQTRARLQAKAEQTRTRFNETAEQTRARLNAVNARTRMQYQQGRERVGRTFDEQPLILAALGLAAGAALGALLPSTRRENQLLGETKEQFLAQTQEVASRQAEVAKEAVQRVADVVKEKAQVVAQTVQQEAQVVAQAAQDEIQRAESEIVERTQSKTLGVPRPGQDR